MEIVVDRVAGLDVHKDTVMACVRTPGGRGRAQEVKEFSTFTRQLERLREWLIAERVTLVVMEATGVYWKPVWHVLCEMGDGVELMLVNARHVKNLPGPQDRRVGLGMASVTWRVWTVTRFVRTASSDC